MAKKIGYGKLKGWGAAVLLLVAFLFLFPVNPMSAEDDNSSIESLEIVNYSDTSIVVKIFFEQSISELRRDYLNNEGILGQFLSAMADILKNPKFALSGIYIESACSPEGSMNFNIELGKGRAAVLRQALTDNFNIADSLIHVMPGGPDWAGLADLIIANKDEIKHGDEALEVISQNPMTSKFDVKAHNRRLAIFDSLYNRTVWDQLHEMFFVQLRKTVVEVRFDGRFLNTINYLKSGIISKNLTPLALDTYLIEQPEIKPLPSLMPVTSVVDKKQQMLAVKTNLLFLLAYVPNYGFCPVPNIGLEYLPRNGHWTVGASLDIPWYRNYSNHKFFQIRNWQLEGRRYFNGNAEYWGWYAQAYVHTGVFGIGFNKQQGWEGESVGFGLGGGYVMPLSRDKRLKLEFNLQVGYMRTQYDPYVYGHPTDGKEDGLYYYDWIYNPDLFKERQYRHNWFGPTRVGVTLRYDLFNYPAEKK